MALIDKEKLLDEILERVAWWDMRVDQEMGVESSTVKNPLLRQVRDNRRAWTSAWKMVDSQDEVAEGIDV